MPTDIKELATRWAAEVALSPQDGDFIVIGPECFAAADGSVLCWRGVNYVPQKPADE